jgi:hypothetical protein
VVPAPIIGTFYGGHFLPLTLDSGANSSVICLQTAERIGLPMQNCRQDAWQADGKCKLEKCGEVNFVLTRGKLQFHMNAIVVKDLNCEVLAGVPFLKDNHISVDIPHIELL